MNSPLRAAVQAMDDERSAPPLTVVPPAPMKPPPSFVQRYQRAMLTTARVAVVLAAIGLPFSTSATNVAFALAFIAWALSGRLLPMLRVAAGHPVARGAAVLLLLTLAGVAWSSASPAEAAEAVGKYRKLLLLMMLLPLLDTRYWQRAVLIGLFGATTALLLLSTGIHLAVPGLPAPHPHQGAIVLRNHVSHGFLMALLVIALVGFAATTSRPAWRLAAAAVAVLAVVNAVVMVNSRTGYLTFAALLLLAAGYRYRFRGVVIAAALGALIGAVAYQAVPALQSRVDAAVSDVRAFARGDVVTPTGIRLHFYQRALSIARDHPWIGAGTGSWPGEYQRRSANDPAELRQVSGMGNPHSEYLLTLVQWGALGLLLHVAALVLLLRLAQQLPPRQAWIAGGTIVAFAVGSLFNSFFWDTTEGHALVLAIGALFGGRWPPEHGTV